MKKGLLAIAILVAFILAGIAFAQEAIQNETQQASLIAKAKTHQCAKEGKRISMQINRMIVGSFFLHPRLIDELDLTDEQVSKLEKMKADSAKKKIDTRAEMQKIQVDLMLMMRKMDMDIAGIQAKMEKISRLKVSMNIAKLKDFEQAKTVLTADQKKKLEEIWKGKYCPRKMKMKEKKEKTEGIDKQEISGIELENRSEVATDLVED